jgi:hypothetical protein
LFWTFLHAYTQSPSGCYDYFLGFFGKNLAASKEKELPDFDLGNTPNKPPHCPTCLSACTLRTVTDILGFYHKLGGSVCMMFATSCKDLAILA